MRFFPAALIVIAGALGIGLGFWLGHTKQDTQRDSSSTPECATLATARKNLLQLSQNEYQIYLKTRDLTERNRRADELLSHVMLLFLADLGARPSPPQPQNSNAADRRLSQGAPEATNPGAGPVPSAIGKADRTWIKAGLKVLSSNSEQEASEALGAAEIPNLFHELHTSLPLSAEQLRRVNGAYSGDIVFFDGREPWHVEWRLDGRIEKNQLVGVQEIILSKGGKIFSRSRGNGNLKNFAAFAGDPEAILVNAYDDDGYLQLYPVELLQKIVGNFYLKRNLDQFDRAGTLSLQRLE